MLSPEVIHRDEYDARRAVEEMAANGAQFTVTRREDGTPGNARRRQSLGLSSDYRRGKTKQRHILEGFR
jgi:hypothetical protein